jgi:hypothetical protein
MDSPDAETPQQKYRKSLKCIIARERYYASKGKATSHEYYLKNKEKILERSKARYNLMKTQCELLKPQEN